MRFLCTLILSLFATHMFAQCDYPLSTQLEIGTFNDCYFPSIGITDMPIGAYAQPNCGVGPYTGNWYSVTTGLNGKLILDYENIGLGVVYAAIFTVDGCFGSDDMVLCNPLPQSVYTDLQLLPLTDYIILIYSDISGPSSYTLCVQEDPCGQGIPNFTWASNVSHHGATVNWDIANPLPSGGRYVLRYHELGDSPNFSHQTTANVNATSMYVNGLEADTRYVCRIGVKCVGQTVATFSDTFSIQTKKLPCPIPTGLTSTANGNETMTLSWDEMGVESYKVRIFQSANSYRNTESNQVTIPVTPGLSYAWQVRSLCENGRGSVYSPYDGFVYGISSGGNSSPAEIFPNPAAHEFSVKWESESEQPLVIRVLDMSGRELQIQTEIAFTGSNRFDYELPEHITSGLYTVEVSSGSERQTTMLKVIR